jgi:SWIM zinc finger
MARGKAPVSTPIACPDGSWLVRSSDGQRFYRVRLQPRSCQCSGFLFARWKLDCRHIRAVKALVRKGTDDDSAA